MTLSIQNVFHSFVRSFVRFQNGFEHYDCNNGKACLLFFLFVCEPLDNSVSNWISRLMLLNGWCWWLWRRRRLPPRIGDNCRLNAGVMRVAPIFFVGWLVEVAEPLSSPTKHVPLAVTIFDSVLITCLASPQSWHSLSRSLPGSFIHTLHRYGTIWTGINLFFRYESHIPLMSRQQQMDIWQILKKC